MCLTHKRGSIILVKFKKKKNLNHRAYSSQVIGFWSIIISFFKWREKLCPLQQKLESSVQSWYWDSWPWNARVVKSGFPIDSELSWGAQDKSNHLVQVKGYHRSSEKMAANHPFNSIHTCTLHYSQQECSFSLPLQHALPIESNRVISYKLQAWALRGFTASFCYLRSQPPS